LWDDFFEKVREFVPSPFFVQFWSRCVKVALWSTGCTNDMILRARNASEIDKGFVRNQDVVLKGESP
jgi:hypothetical protein